MDIHFLDVENLMVMITFRSPFTGPKITELTQEIKALKAKGAMGYIFDFSNTPYIGTGAIAYMSVLGAEATMGNDVLRAICPNSKFVQHFELSGLSKFLKIINTKELAVDELKNVLFIEGDLPAPILYKQAQIMKTVSTDTEDDGEAPIAGASAAASVSTALPPPPPSQAGSKEELPMVFVIEDIAPMNVPRSYMMPPNRDNDANVQSELKQIAHKLKERNDVLVKLGQLILKNTDESQLNKRSYPVREWSRSFLVKQGTEPKLRHILFNVGALVSKKAKNLSYSAKGALDEYELTPYVLVSVLEPCEIYGAGIDSREANGWLFNMFSMREPKLQDFGLILLDHAWAFVKKQKGIEDTPSPAPATAPTPAAKT